jgi:hypothetical protein
VNDDSPSSNKRFQSIITLAVNARATFERFPFAILSAIVAAAGAHRLVITDFDITEPAFGLFLTGTLGISLFFSLRMLGEGRGWSRNVRLGVSLAGLVALVIHYLTLPGPALGTDFYRFWLLMAVVHLFASFAPFIGRRGEENGFWQYNKALLLRGALAAIYAGVLFVGLALALAACDTLLGLEVEGKTYGQLLFWVGFVYSAWFFMAGAPRDVQALDAVQEYPIGLRIFTQFLLIPLVVIYLVILYAYLIKIVIQWNLPTGWVTYPVIGLSIAGILAMLLVYPIRERAENAWIKNYARFFFWSLYPLIALTALAIWIRVSEYGITERRYLVIVATAWLLGITLYFTVRRTRNIRVIPISLCIISLFSIVGPWSGTAMAKRDQLGRLRDALVTEAVMTDVGLTRERKTLEFEHEQQISNIVSYLDEMHGLDAIREWYAEPERLAEALTPSIALEEMGLRFRTRWERAERINFSANAPEPLSVADFDYVFLLSESFDEDDEEMERALDDLTHLTLERTLLTLGRTGFEEGGLSIDLEPKILELDARNKAGEELGADDVMIAAENAAYRLVLYITEAFGATEADSLQLDRLAATILIEVKSSVD